MVRVISSTLLATLVVIAQAAVLQHSSERSSFSLASEEEPESSIKILQDAAHGQQAQFDDPTIALSVKIDGKPKKRKNKWKGRDYTKRYYETQNWNIPRFRQGKFRNRKPIVSVPVKEKIKAKDFVKGTLIIDKPGNYQLTEDVEFEPSPIRPSVHSEEYQISDGYFLGFFAAISFSIPYNGNLRKTAMNKFQVKLNCQTQKKKGKRINHEIKMSKHFHKNQRFFAIMELGSRPFIAGAGPPPFGSDSMTPSHDPETLSPNPLWPANHIWIKNCVLGRSSHHGIHGNNAFHILVQNTKIYDFEVAGWACNNCSAVELRGLSIGPSCGVVPERCEAFPSALSQAINLDFMVNTVARGIITDEQDLATIMDQESIWLRGWKEDGVLTNHPKIASVFEELRSAVYEFVKKDSEEQNVLFKKTRWPDGSAMYGILFNCRAPAVGSFGAHSTQDLVAEDYTYYVQMHNIKIRNLILKPQAWVRLEAEKQMQGPAGSVFRFTHAVDQTDTCLEQYNGDNSNVLANALIATNALLRSATQSPENRQKILNGEDETRASVLAQTYLNGSNIDLKIHEWAADTERKKTLRFDEFSVKCDSDSMSHFNKGTIGVRLEYLMKPYLDDVRMDKLENKGGQFEDLTKLFRGCDDEDKPNEFGPLVLDECNIWPSRWYQGNDCFGSILVNTYDTKWIGSYKKFPDLKAGDYGMAFVHTTYYT